MSGRVRTSIPCWCLNGKKLTHGWGKLGRTTRQLANRHITLMSINNYHMAHYTWMMTQWVLCIWSLCTRVVLLIGAIWSICVMYNVKCLWIVMCRRIFFCDLCRKIMYYVLLEPTILCMCRTMCLKLINDRVKLIIYTTSYTCDHCMTYLFDGQLLVLLNGWVFFLFAGHCFCCIKYMSC
jgi:hypothetical protein